MANADFSREQNQTPGGFDSGSYREAKRPDTEAVRLTPLQQKLAGLEAKLPAALSADAPHPDAARESYPEPLGKGLLFRRADQKETARQPLRNSWESKFPWFHRAYTRPHTPTLHPSLPTSLPAPANRPTNWHIPSLPEDTQTVDESAQYGKLTP